MTAENSIILSSGNPVIVYKKSVGYTMMFFYNVILSQIMCSHREFILKLVLL